MIFNLVKDLFKGVEVLSRSVIVLVGSKTDIIFHIGDVRKKYKLFIFLVLFSIVVSLVSFVQTRFSTYRTSCKSGTTQPRVSGDTTKCKLGTPPRVEVGPLSPGYQGYSTDLGVNLCSIFSPIVRACYNIYLKVYQ